MNVVCDVVKVTLDLVVLALDLLDLLFLRVEFILLGRKVLVQIDLDVFFGGQLLLEQKLLASTFLQLSPGLEEFLLLFHGFFHVFRALKQLAFHVIDFLKKFLLFIFLLLLLGVLVF